MDSALKVQHVGHHVLHILCRKLDIRPRRPSPYPICESSEMQAQQKFQINIFIKKLLHHIGNVN